MSEEKEIVLSIKTDTSQATAGVAELKTQLQGVNNTPVDKPFKSFKQEIKEAITDAKRLEEQFGKNSKEFTNAAKRVAELKDRFGEFNQTIASFNPDNKLQALVSVAKGATGAIQGVTGAMTLMGGESEKATQVIARLQGLMAFSQALNSVDDIKNSFKNFNVVLQSSTTFQKANAIATAITSFTLKALGVSTETTAIGFKVLKGAIVATGIGALAIGLILLIQNFDAVKKTILNLIPGLGSAFSFFGKLFDSITDFIGVTSEAERATQKLIETTEKQIKQTESFLDANGYKYDEYTQRKIKANLEYNKHLVEINKDETLKEAEKQALLKQYRDKADFEIDKATKDRKEKIDKDKEESDKKVEAENKKQGTERKKKEEDLARFRDKYKQNLEQLQSIQDEANKKLTESTQNERQKEITDVNFTYSEKMKAIKKSFEDEQKELAKAKKDGLIAQTEFNSKSKELSTKKSEAEIQLGTATVAQEIAIEEKYHQKVLDLLNEATTTEYEKQKVDIKKKYDDLIKVANDGDKLLLEVAKQRALTKAGNENTTKINVIKSETNLIKTERENTPDENDTPEVARAKIINLTQARLTAENEAFELKKLQLVGQQEELAKAAEDHQTKITGIQKTASDTRKLIDKNEKEAKINFYSSIGNSATQLSDVIGKQTVAGKALAIAGIVAQQAATVGKIIMSTKEANMKAVAASPLTLGQPWVGINTVQGVISGIASVAAGAKAISAIGGSGGGASNTGDISQINAGTAPQINAQSATAQQIQDVRVTNENQRPIKAYITNSDLQTNQQKTNFLNSISTI